MELDELIPGVQYRIKSKIGKYHSNSGTHVRFIINRKLKEFPKTTLSKTRKNRKSKKTYT